jgi:hypothetical protein
MTRLASTIALLLALIPLMVWAALKTAAMTLLGVVCTILDVWAKPHQ